MDETTKENEKLSFMVKDLEGKKFNINSDLTNQIDEIKSLREQVAGKFEIEQRYQLLLKEMKQNQKTMRVIYIYICIYLSLEIK